MADTFAHLANVLQSRPLVVHAPPNIPVPTYDGTGDITSWIRQFTTVASLNQWNPQQQFQLVEFHLQGAALSFHKRASREHESWETYAAALTRAFARPYSQNAVRKFLDRIQEPGESFMSYVHHKYHLASEAGPPFSTFDGCKVELVSGLNDVRLRDIFTANDPDTFQDLLDVYDRYLAIEKAPRNTSIVSKNPQPCTQFPRSTSEGKQAHPTTLTHPATCFGCRQPGHLWRECPSKRVSAVQLSNHAITKAPTILIDLAGCPRDALLDCGAEISAISSNLLQSDVNLIDWDGTPTSSFY
jgi:hypothetical protein